jgi:hypothetical protein
VKARVFVPLASFALACAAIVAGCSAVLGLEDRSEDPSFEDGGDEIGSGDAHGDIGGGDAHDPHDGGDTGDASTIDSTIDSAIDSHTDTAPEAGDTGDASDTNDGAIDDTTTTTDSGSATDSTTSIDTGVDTFVDSDIDTTIGVDTDTDSGVADSGFDSGTDSGFDSGGADTTPDSIVDSGHDSAIDTTTDSGGGTDSILTGDGTVDDIGGGFACSSVDVPGGGSGPTASTGAGGPPSGDACQEFWERTLGSTSAFAANYLGAGTHGPGGEQFRFYCSAGNIGFEFSDAVKSGAFTALEYAAPCDDGAWHHVAACRVTGPSPSVTVYFDGAPFTSYPGGMVASPPGELMIGGIVSDATKIEVEIDEVRISTVDRYSGATFTPSKRFASDTFTVSLYHFDEGAGATSADATGHGFNLSFAAGDAWSTSCP